MDRQASAREKKELKRAQKDLKRAAKQLLKEQKAAEKAARRMSKRLIKSAAKHKDKMPQPELSRDRFSPTPLSTTGSIYSTTSNVVLDDAGWPLTDAEVEKAATLRPKGKGAAPAPAVDMFVSPVRERPASVLSGRKSTSQFSPGNDGLREEDFFPLDDAENARALMLTPRQTPTKTRRTTELTPKGATPKSSGRTPLGDSNSNRGASAMSLLSSPGMKFPSQRQDTQGKLVVLSPFSEVVNRAAQFASSVTGSDSPIKKLEQPVFAPRIRNHAVRQQQAEKQERVERIRSMGAYRY